MRYATTIGGVLAAGLLVFGSAARAQPAATGTPPPASRPEPPPDALGRDTPRGAVLGFLIAAREAGYEYAARDLNTRQVGDAGAELARQLFVVLDRRLPAGLAQLSDRPEGGSP